MISPRVVIGEILLKEVEAEATSLRLFAIVRSKIAWPPADRFDPPTVPDAKILTAPRVPVKLGEADIAKVLPVPVCEAMEVALPIEVIGPVRLALVVTVAALPEVF